MKRLVRSIIDPSPRNLSVKSLTVVVGMLAVSQALDSCVVLLGLQRFGALDHINRVLARASGGMLGLLTIAIALGPGVAEEMFFRGYMQTRLVQRYGLALAIGVTAACFGLLHFDPVHTPVAAVLGLFIGWAVERTGTIVLSALVAHTAWHWMADRWDRLREFAPPAVDATVLLTMVRWTIAAIVVAGVAWLVAGIARRRRRHALAAAEYAEHADPVS